MSQKMNVQNDFADHAVFHFQQDYAVFVLDLLVCRIISTSSLIFQRIHLQLCLLKTNWANIIHKELN